MSHLSSKFPRSLLKGNYSLYEVQDLGTAHTWWFGRRRSCSGGSGRPPVRDRCSCLVCCCCCCGGSDASRFALLTPCSPCTKPQMLMIVIESCVSVPGHSCRFHLLPPLQIRSGEISAARSVNIPLHLAADARKDTFGTLYNKIIMGDTASWRCQPTRASLASGGCLIRRVLHWPRDCFGCCCDGHGSSLRASDQISQVRRQILQQQGRIHLNAVDS